MRAVIGPCGISMRRKGKCDSRSKPSKAEIQQMTGLKMTGSWPQNPIASGAMLPLI
jgi:hypothetical protein